jgi:hypothetical protein
MKPALVEIASQKRLQSLEKTFTYHVYFCRKIFFDKKRRVSSNFLPAKRPYFYSKTAEKVSKKESRLVFILLPDAHFLSESGFSGF